MSSKIYNITLLISGINNQTPIISSNSPFININTIPNQTPFTSSSCLTNNIFLQISSCTNYILLPPSNCSKISLLITNYNNSRDLIKDLSHSIVDPRCNLELSTAFMVRKDNELSIMLHCKCLIKHDFQLELN